MDSTPHHSYRFQNSLNNYVQHQAKCQEGKWKGWFKLGCHNIWVFLRTKEAFKQKTSKNPFLQVSVRICVQTEAEQDTLSQFQMFPHPYYI